MGKPDAKNCSRCKGKLKKQMLGMNILYFCPGCGYHVSGHFL
ncbi:hypothetical protein [Methanomethylovorans sp.]